MLGGDLSWSGVTNEGLGGMDGGSSLDMDGGKEVLMGLDGREWTPVHDSRRLGDPEGGDWTEIILVRTTNVN